MPRVHPTACIEPGARLADGAEIGPYCIIGANVSIAEGVQLVSHVHVAGTTSIGPRTVIYPFASLGTPPQSVHYRGGATFLIIGADCDIREGVTMNVGTENGGGVTRVGDHGFFMANSHVAHDSQIGKQVTFANNAVIGGHVSIGDYVVLGGQAAVHQFVRVGEGAMIGGVSGVRRDVIPFGFASGQHARLVGLNVVGLKRRGCDRGQLHRLRSLYGELFFGPRTMAERVIDAANQYGSDPFASKILNFIRDGSPRGFTLPGAVDRQDDGDT